MSVEGNWAALDDILADDFELHMATYPTLHTLDDYKQVTAAFRASSPPGHWSIEKMVAEGDTVVGCMMGRGVHSAPWRDTPATGKEVAMELICWARLAGGRIVEARQISGGVSLLRQIGTLPI